ncbi:MAG: DNRLRE domain-containing protein [Bacteroidales bacterium]|nr:DNRLRE domain-containing protein [Bacteroidales bacterium]
MKNLKNPVIWLLFSLCLISAENTAQDTIFIQPGPEDGKDAIIHSLYPYTNYGDLLSLIAAAWTYQSDFGIIRGLFEFDLDSIPSDLQIKEAFLNLYYNPTCGHEGHGGENSAWIRKVTGNWNEYTVNWINQPPTSSENQIILPASTSTTQDYLGIPLTDLVQEMISNPEENFGFQLRIQNEEVYRSLTFASSDYPITSLRPMLVIIPECQSPISYYTYEDLGNFVEFTDSSSFVESWYWSFGDGFYSTLQNPTHYYNEPGLYDACLIAFNDCGSDTLCRVVRIALTSTDEQSQNNNLAIGPNPIKDFINVCLIQSTEEKSILYIYNNLGKLINQFKLENHTIEFKINCSSFEPGIYFLVIHGDKNTTTQKFLKL